MASAHIEINGNGRLNGKLRSTVDLLRKVQQMVGETKATYDQLALGSDWEALANALDLDPVDQLDDAEDIYNLIGSVQTEINGTFINQLLGRLG